MLTVITSTYKGNQYLPKLLSMLEENTLTLQEKHPDLQVEYILVNDSPWIPLELPETGGLHFTLRTLINPENYGIHKSRAAGIIAAQGAYITILDQDDEIAPNFLLSQYECLGDGDAVVCNGIKEFDNYTKPIYKDHLKMRLVNHKLFYLKAANQIVSPGQTMLRKSVIPAAWLENPQAVNGADDLFLWLLMLHDGIRFVKNPESLYVHKQVGDNLSNSLEAMSNSDLEMCRLLRQKQLLPEKAIRKRERMCAFMKACGYRSRPTLKAALLYPDVLILKLFAYFI